jgi:hypothetical protein
LLAYEDHLFLPKLQELVGAAARYWDVVATVDPRRTEPPPPTTSVSFHHLEVAPLTPPVHPVLKPSARAHLIDQRATVSRAGTDTGGVVTAVGECPHAPPRLGRPGRCCGPPWPFGPCAHQATIYLAL